MRIFIVGATGVLGRVLIPQLFAQGHTVRALVRTPDKARCLVHSGLEIIQGDLLAQETSGQLPYMMAGCDAAIHIATAIPRDISAPEAWDTTTRLRTEGTQYMLEAALTANVTHYIQQSIVVAYPDKKDRWIDENTPLDFSLARAAICAPIINMENLIHAVSPQHLHWTILRGGTFVGRGTAQDNLVEMLRTGQAVVPGDGSNYFSFVHVADMASAITLALQHAPAGSTFNIVAEAIQYAEYIDHLADLLHVPRPPRDLSLPCPPSFRCCSEAARSLLRWEPIHSIYSDIE